MIIHPDDNVEIREDGHKYALKPISAGENVIKYGMPIGHAVKAIAPCEHVHTHNLATNLAGHLKYEYEPELEWKPSADEKLTFQGYLHPDGQAGIRNHIWIIPTVGCVNKVARRLADATGSIALEHPYGCSQLGDDHSNTADLLAALARNPNAGGVLILALGCENNTLDSFRERLGDVSQLNIRFLKCQEAEDEFQEGLRLVEELKQNRVQERQELPISMLRVGLKCGGSDGFSGLTANPLCGRFSDWLTAQGGTTLLTEVPEMFGAETLLMKRCVSEEVFLKCVAMIDDFKSYYERHNQVIYENPSPGNKAGGITTLEEKSLGCVQKGGTSPVTDVLKYAERVKKTGLNLITGPGNDLVASTLLAAAGCQLLLFTTGRGTPFGTVIPTVKVATNTPLAEKKKNWIDYDAMKCPDTRGFIEKILAAANGEETRNEINGDREIAIFKDGVTL